MGGKCLFRLHSCNILVYASKAHFIIKSFQWGTAASCDSLEVTGKDKARATLEKSKSYQNIQFEFTNQTNQWLIQLHNPFIGTCIVP